MELPERLLRQSEFLRRNDRRGWGCPIHIQSIAQTRMRINLGKIQDGRSRVASPPARMAMGIWESGWLIVRKITIQKRCLQNYFNSASPN